MQIKKFIWNVTALIALAGIIGCASPARSNAYSMQQAEGSVIEFQTLSQEDIKFSFLANYYYSESKFRRSKSLIAESVFPDLSTEARARRQAMKGLNTLEAEITSEFERRLGQELNKYAGKVFRARLQDKGAINAKMLSPNAKNLAISAEVFPHPFLQKQYRSTSIASPKLSGLLESVGGPKSNLSLRYPYMEALVTLPVSNSEFQDMVYAAQKSGKDRIQYTMEFVVDFTLNCAENCDYKVLGTQVINYSLK